MTEPSDLPPSALPSPTRAAPPRPPPNPDDAAAATAARGCLVVLGVMCLAGAILAPTLGRVRESSSRIYCASNLRQIAMACIVYTQTNDGRFPDTVATLFEQSDLGAAERGSVVFVCPNTKELLAVGPTTRTAAAMLQASPPPGRPGCCRSYAYVGAGLMSRAASDVVVAYEPPINHAGLGGNVAYADAHVEWHPAAELDAIIAAVQVGRNPPPAAATRPAADGP